MGTTATTVGKPLPPVASGGLPGIGHGLAFYKDRNKVIQKGFEEHGSVFALKLGPRNVAVLVGPEHQRAFFTETDRRLDMREPYTFLHAMFGDVLFLASKETYQLHRPVLKDLFRRERLVGYVDHMNDVVQAWVDGLGESGEFDADELSRWMVKQVVGRCFLGEEVTAQIGQEFWDLYGDLSKAIDPILPSNLPHPKFLRRDRAKARMMEILRPILDERRAHPDRYDDLLQDIMSMRDRNGDPIADEVVRNMLLGILFAGHETTAGQAAWMLITMVQHPEYLAAVRAEVDRVAPDPEPIDIGKVVQLEHLAWANREVERLLPSVDLLLRKVEEDMEFGDYRVPAGWLVQTAQGIGHRLPAYFDRPEVFDPYRHAPGRAEDKQDRFLMGGFGGGVHKCIGMNFANFEIAILAALLFRRHDVELVTEHPQVVCGMGANHPSTTILRYRKRVRPAAPDAAARAAVKAAAALGAPLTNRARRAAAVPATCPVAHDDGPPSPPTRAEPVAVGCPMTV